MIPPDVVPFLAGVIAFAIVGVGAGILIARRIDAWQTAADEAPDGSEQEPDA